MTSNKPEIISRVFSENGSFPNNGKLPLVIMKQVHGTNSSQPEMFESLFNTNRWPAAWRNGLFDVHHYHSTAHEVLGIYSGWVRACFGGPGGETFEAKAGDVIIIPAGVSHCNKGQSDDFRVVGAYPEGQSRDMQYGKPGERPQTDTNIGAVGMPGDDPVFGNNGPLLKLWR